MNERCRRLVAKDAVIHVPLGRALRCAEADANYYAAECESLRARAKAKPRRKSQAALVNTAKRTGLTVTALNPDGSVSTGQGERAEHVNGNPWDEVLHHDR
jgi:hypothetical protein